jgi:hypothetical protein
MNITYAQYQTLDDKNRNIKIVVDGVTMHVPLEVGNRHYAEILRQVADGTLTIQDAD